jgi:hypothetical protein
LQKLITNIYVYTADFSDIPSPPPLLNPMSIRSLHFDEEEITRQKNVFLVQMSYSAKKTEKDRKRQKRTQ